MSTGPFPGEGRFPTTHWSLVAQAGQDVMAVRRAALDQLLRRYLPALRAHLVYGRRLPPDEADDVVQDFVTSRIIEHDLLARADRDRGKFRTYLLAALDRFLIDRVRRQRAHKRAPDGGACHALGDDAEAVAAPVPSDAFDEAWAREVIQTSIQQLQAECRQSGRDDVWLVFEGRVLAPLLDGAAPVDYEALVGRCGLQSAAQASNVLITGKRMFARLLRAVVGQYTLGDEAIDSEIRDLHQVLAQSRR